MKHRRNSTVLYKTLLTEIWLSNQGLKKIVIMDSIQITGLLILLLIGRRNNDNPLIMQSIQPRQFVLV